MGKSSNPQPSHPLADAGAAPCPVQAPPSKLPGVSTSRVQPFSFPVSSSNRPSAQLKSPSAATLSHDLSSSLSISPLTATLSSSPLPVYPDTYLDSTPPLSPTDDDDEFFDAKDDLFEVPPTVSVKPVRTSGVQQALPEPFLEGASKGRMGVSGPRASIRTGPYPSTPAPAYSPLPPARGSSKPSASPPATQPPPTLLATRVPSLFASPLSSSLVAQPQPTKRALLIGINYHHLDKTKRLKYAAKDAQRFGAMLAEAVSFKEIRLLTDDDKRSPPPTGENILRCFDWLVRDAKAGDQLVVLFSGHCAYVQGQGPYLVAAGHNLISKEDLKGRLLSKIPAQCKLNLVLDCCHSAAFVDLQYCVGKMGHELETDALVEETPAGIHAEMQRALSNPIQAPTPVAPALKPGSAQPSERSAPHLASLNGIHIPEDAPPAAPPPIALKLGMDSFASPSRPATPGMTAHRAPRRAGGVVAAPPMASAAPEEPGIGASILASLMGAATSTSSAKNTAAPVTSGEMRKTRQLVVEGAREHDYFKERKEGFVETKGEVTVWAAAGANQLAFEASGGVENGVVTNALCSALAACGGKIPTRREVWRYLTSSLETENAQRGNRDQAKAEPPDKAKRIQHAELWVSQADPLSSAARVLDDPAF